jgi:hypothetical protein
MFPSIGWHLFERTAQFCLNRQVTHLPPQMPHACQSMRSTENIISPCVHALLRITRSRISEGLPYTRSSIPPARLKGERRPHEVRGPLLNILRLRCTERRSKLCCSVRHRCHASIRTGTCRSESSWRRQWTCPGSPTRCRRTGSYSGNGPGSRFGSFGSNLGQDTGYPDSVLFRPCGQMLGSASVPKDGPCTAPYSPVHGT